MKIEIRATSVFEVPLTMAGVNALMKLSRHHYDHRCKQASVEGDGGFLHAWKKRIQCSLDLKVEVTPTRAIWGDLDTCLKLMELPLRSLLTKREVVLCSTMNMAFHGALNVANEKYNEWQASYEWPVSKLTAAGRRRATRWSET